MHKTPALDFRRFDTTIASRYRFSLLLIVSGVVTVRNYRFRFLSLTEFCVPIWSRIGSAPVTQISAVDIPGRSFY